jgi:plasmid stabilization system protein ParE
VIVVWSPRAAGHLARLREYIGRDDPNAAARVAGNILISVELLAQQPGMGCAGRVFGTRELVVAGTPFIIPYRVRNDRLELIAVFHGRQKWSARL